MLNVLIKSESRYPVSKERISSTVSRVIEEKKVTGDIEVSVSIVGNRLMKRLNKTYRDLDKTTDVLSFSLTERKDDTTFIDPPGDVLRLGDVVVSYPEAVDEASNEDKMVDQKIDELVEHGVLHLLGYHHD